MELYRLFLLQQGKIVTRHDFSVENDDWARRAAALVFDACSERCDDFELWDGARLVTTRDGLKTQPSMAASEASLSGPDAYTATLEEAIAGIAVTILEAAVAASAVLRTSPRLNSRLIELRRSSAAPQ